MSTRTAFGGMLRDIVELDSIVLRPEPFDKEIERRCKQAWEQAPCPECGETAVQSGDGSPRVWCRNCRYTFTYTRKRPSKTALSHPVRSFWSSSSTRTLSSASTRSPSCSIPSTILSTRHCEREKPPLSAASPSSGNVSSTPSTALPRSMKPATNVRATRDRRRRGKGRPAAVPVIVGDHAGKEPRMIR